MAETQDKTQPIEAINPSLEERTGSLVIQDAVGHSIIYSLTETLQDGKLIGVTLKPITPAHAGSTIPMNALDKVVGLYRSEANYFGPIRIFDLKVENPEVKH